MKKLIAALIVLGSTTPAFARDSTWKLCTGDATVFDDPAKLAVNVFEHRNSTGDGRDTEFTLIFGGWVLRGTLDTSDSDTGTVHLQDEKNTEGVYDGTIGVNYDKDTVTLKGVLDLGEKTDINATLKCKTLGN